jgi:hypothetical protein
MKEKIQLKLKRWIPTMIIVLMITVPIFAQELNCSVSVNDRQISGSTYDYISELSGDIERYLNENRWTDDRFGENEQILCNIQILLTGADSQFNFTAEAVFTVRRPIYNTNQQSTSIVISDNNWRFSYPRNKNLIYDELQFDDLSSFLDFYAYVIIGLDYDSFSELGGSRWLNRAQTIFDLAQNTGAFGWGRSIGAQRNRYGLINDLTSTAYQDLRIAYYKYHRLGLDQFTISPEESREEVIDALQLLRENKRLTSNNYLFDIFFSTKYTEIVSLLMDANVQTRTRAYNILRDVDPAHTTEYEKLQN